MNLGKERLEAVLRDYELQFAAEKIPADTQSPFELGRLMERESLVKRLREKIRELDSDLRTVSTGDTKLTVLG